MNVFACDIYNEESGQYIDNEEKGDLLWADRQKITAFDSKIDNIITPECREKLERNGIFFYEKAFDNLTPYIENFDGDLSECSIDD